MAVREFDGIDDTIIASLGTAGIKAGPVTWGALVKITVSSTWDFVHGAGDAAFGGLFFYHSAGDTVRVVQDGVADNGAITWNATTGWAIAVATKASGTSAVTAHLFPIGGAWTHTAGGTLPDSTATLTAYRFGRQGDASDPAAMRLAVAGIWNVVLSNAQCVELGANLKTSDWWNNSAGQPKGLWEFNQASVGTNVLDLTPGGANQTSIVGTTVVTGDDPPGWTFDGTGSAPNPVDVGTHRMPLAA